MKMNIHKIAYMVMSRGDLDKLNAEANTLAEGCGNTLLTADQAREAGLDVGDWNGDIIAYCN